jgi:hypothetical protein
MQRIIHITSFDRNIVNVLQLLRHLVVVADLLGMTTLFPNLVVALDFVTALERLKLVEKECGSLLFQQIDDLPGRVHFEALHHAGKLRS